MRSALFALPVALIALSACEAPVTPVDTGSAAYFAEKLPDERILVALPVAAERALGQLAPSYVDTARISSDVNGLIASVLVLVDRITDFEPTWSAADDRWMWGPWSGNGLDPNQSALWVARDDATGVYTWALVQRPKGSGAEVDWVAVIAGEAIEGSTSHTGTGGFVVDFDALAALNPAESATGVFVSTYTLDPDGSVQAEALFDGFAENPDQTPLTAGYAYASDPLGAGSMDFVFDAELDGNPLLETALVRSRWTADGAGRADVVVAEGDIAPLVVHGVECWDEGFLTVYESSNLTMHAAGDPADCAFAEPEWHADAPEA